MGRDGLLIGEVTKRSGASRKALRLYEATGILPAPRRAASGYRVYGADALDLLAFVRRAQGFGFTLDEIKDIVSIKRTGQALCPRVCDLIRRKAEELDQRLSDLTEMRKNLRTPINGWRGARTADAAVCPIIERPRLRKPRR